MSAQTKQTVQEVKKTFERIQKEAGDAAKKVGGLDGDLARKIHKISEGSGEVVKHIEERSGK